MLKLAQVIAGTYQTNPLNPERVVVGVGVVRFCSDERISQYRRVEK